MYVKRILSIFITLLLFTSLQGKENELGKFLGGKDTSMPSWFYDSFLNLEDDIEELAEKNKQLILFIHQDNCPYCHLFITKNLKNENLKNRLLEHFEIVDINMFGDREIVDVDGKEYNEKEFAKKHKVQFTPTIIFFDTKGKQILRLNGYANIKNFNTAIDFIRNKKYKSMTYNEYLVKSQKDSKLMNESDLFTDSKNFVRTNSSKKMAIFFESGDCDECDILHKELLKDEITRTLLKKIDLFQVDMNSSKSIVSPEKIITKINTWTKELNITHTPTIIFFDENANEIIRIESLFKNFHFQSIVDYVVSNAYKDEKEFQRYLTKRANALRKKGIDVNIWE